MRYLKLVEMYLGEKIYLRHTFSFGVFFSFRMSSFCLEGEMNGQWEGIQMFCSHFHAIDLYLTVHVLDGGDFVTGLSKEILKWQMLRKLSSAKNVQGGIILNKEPHYSKDFLDLKKSDMPQMGKSAPLLPLFHA